MLDPAGNEIRDLYRTEVENFSNLLNEEVSGNGGDDVDEERVIDPCDMDGEGCEKFGVAEVMSAINALSNGKSPGIDGVSAEMLKYGGMAVVSWMTDLCNLCLENGEVPQDWRDAIIVALYKGKGVRSECKNFRGISLLSIPGKVFGKMVIERVRKLTCERVWDVQSGFMPGRSCIDQVFSLRMIVEKYLAVDRKVFSVFIDLEKAYDRVDRLLLWKVLAEYGVNGKLLRAIQAMYDNSRACVRMSGRESGLFQIDKGVRQGCVMSPWLFNVFLDACMHEESCRWGFRSSDW